ncbi:hypothetical protein [Crossiella cryophila]|uniref:Uncharacterized protein n=1 Tax=Crossiella cryophila TaxID=43355 RepID=A0A7W7FY94_9PSEU|nr:hypothetical protein [Crossiella cryophila]MBB4681845.1 hypothetical protein [Crossiella cryophila]
MSPELRDVIVAAGFITGFLVLGLIAWWSVRFQPGWPASGVHSRRELLARATEFRFPVWPEDADEDLTELAVMVTRCDTDDADGPCWAVRHNSASFDRMGNGLWEKGVVKWTPELGRRFRFSRGEAIQIATTVVAPLVREFWEDSIAKADPEGTDENSTS